MSSRSAGRSATNVSTSRVRASLDAFSLPIGRVTALRLGGGAEAAESVRRQHGRVVGQLRGQPMRRGVLRPREVLGQPGLDQVRAPDGADQQRSAGQRRDRRAVLLQHVGRVMRGVTESRQCAHGQARVGVDLRAVAVVHGDTREGDTASGRHQVGRTCEPGQLQSPSDLVVVHVRLDDLRDPYPTPGGRRDHPIDIAWRINRKGRAPAARQIAAVAEPRDLDRVDEERELLPSSEILPLGVYFRP